MMTTQERQRKAENLGAVADIGKKVKATYPGAFRRDEVATIVGWKFTKDDWLIYIIQFENGECDFVSQTSIKNREYVFVS